MIEYMTKKKLSILIPTYNRASLLDICLSRLSLQGFDNSECEIIVSDNASPDSTKDVVKKYNVKYISNKKNIGFSANLDALLNEYNGEYFLFLGDDDEFIFNWDHIKKILNIDYDLYVFGANEDDVKSGNITNPIFSFIGDCIQKNSEEIKFFLKNYKQKSNSPHFFARINILCNKESKIFYDEKPIIVRMQSQLTELTSEKKGLYDKLATIKALLLELNLRELARKISGSLFGSIDSTYYWYEARKELKVHYSKNVATHWIDIIDKFGDYSRQELLRTTGVVRYNMYWFSKLYCRIFRYPGFSLYMIKNLIISNYRFYKSKS